MSAHGVVEVVAVAIPRALSFVTNFDVVAFGNTIILVSDVVESTNWVTVVRILTQV